MAIFCRSFCVKDQPQLGDETTGEGVCVSLQEMYPTSRSNGSGMELSRRAGARRDIRKRRS